MNMGRLCVHTQFALRVYECELPVSSRNLQCNYVTVHDGRDKQGPRVLQWT